MQLFLILLLTAIGFFLVAKGGDIFVDSAIKIAKKLRMPTLLIGATIVSMGTTLPELLVSSIAAARHDVGLAVSNATGSMFCNLTLILGIALVCKKTACNRGNYVEKLIFSFINIILLILFMINLNLSLVECALLLMLFAAFMAVNIYKAVTKKEVVPLRSEQAAEPFSLLTVAMFLVGAAGIALGANLLVDNVSLLCTEYLKIPTAIVGATVVALGTSLPELVTAINSVKKNNIEMSIGNVLGANIINGTFLVGLSGVLQGTAGMQVATVGGDNLAIVISVAAVFVGMLILAIPILVKSRTNRAQGVLLLTLYAAYIIYLVVNLFV